MGKRYERAMRRGKSKGGQIKQRPKETKGQSEAVNQRKDRKHNGQKIPKGNQKPKIKGRTDNTMAKRYQRAIRSRKSKEGQTTQWPKCPFFDLRLLIALWYLLAIVLSVLPLIYGF
jgi:hypothetical protein